MAGKSLKSNKARIAKQRRQGKAARARKPWRIAGIAFCLGAIVTAGAMAFTPLGRLCIAGDNAAAASATKDDNKPQRGARPQPPDPEQLARIAQGRAARNRGGKDTENKKDPLAELRRIEAINARNRSLLNRHTAHRPGPMGSHDHPRQPTTHQPPGVPRPVMPTHNPTPTTPDRH